MGQTDQPEQGVTALDSDGAPFIYEERPVMGDYPDPSILALSGLEQMRTFFDWGGPRPPIHYLTGMHPTEVTEDTVTFKMPATGWLQAPPGGLYPGALAILADGPLGSAVQIALPPMQFYTTAEISLTYVRPIPLDGRMITCKARTVIVGKSLGLADCVVEDSDGRIVATGSTRCHVFPPLGPPPDEPPEFPPYELPTYDKTPPVEREVAGEIVPQEIWDAHSGLDILLMLIKEELPAPPLRHLTGLKPVDAEEGSATFTLPATGWINSPTGRPIGGATAMLADSALQAAVQTTVPAGTSFAPLDVKVNFIRPVDADDRDLTARGVVKHRGKTTAVATSEVVNADGKLVALATGSALILPDRPWKVDRPVDVADEAGGAPS